MQQADPYLSIKHNMQIAEQAFSDVWLLGGFGKSLLGAGQIAIGAVGTIFSILSFPIHQNTAHIKFYGSTLITHGVGNLGVALLETIPIVNRIFFAYRVQCERMVREDGLLETYYATRARMQEWNACRNPLLSYVEKQDQNEDPNNLYSQSFNYDNWKCIRDNLQKHIDSSTKEYDSWKCAKPKNIFEFIQSEVIWMTSPVIAFFTKATKTHSR